MTSSFPGHYLWDLLFFLGLIPEGKHIYFIHQDNPVSSDASHMLVPPCKRIERRIFLKQGMS